MLSPSAVTHSLRTRTEELPALTSLSKHKTSRRPAPQPENSNSSRAEQPMWARRRAWARFPRPLEGVPRDVTSMADFCCESRTADPPTLSPRQCSLFGRVLSRLLPRCSAYCDDLPDINTSPLDSGHTAQVILLQLDNKRERYESYFERYYSQRVTKSSSPQPHLSSETNTRALCHSSCQSKARRFSFANHRIAREQVITICS